MLESFDLSSDDACESCLLGKMTKSPLTGSCEIGVGLLDLIHTDVCGPFRSSIRDANDSMWLSLIIIVYLVIST